MGIARRLVSASLIWRPKQDLSGMLLIVECDYFWKSCCTARKIVKYTDTDTDTDTKAVKPTLLNKSCSNQKINATLLFQF